MFLEECKHAINEIKKTRHITEDIKVYYSDDNDDDSEEEDFEKNT